MKNNKKIKTKILDMIDKLKNKNFLVEVKFLDEKNEFSVYSSRDLDSLYYKITYIPKKFLLKEGEYYINKFPTFLSSLDSKSEKINYLLQDLEKSAAVVLENVEYHSYFHFTENEVIINLDNFTY